MSPDSGMRIGVVVPMGVSDGPGHLHLIPAPALLAKLAPPPMRSAAAGASWGSGRASPTRSTGPSGI